MEEPVVIQLMVRDQEGTEVAFKVKKDTKISKILEKYAEQKGVAVNSLVFLIDGKHLKHETLETVKTLELEDGDQIDAM